MSISTENEKQTQCAAQSSPTEVNQSPDKDEEENTVTQLICTFCELTGFIDNTSFTASTTLNRILDNNTLRKEPPTVDVNGQWNGIPVQYI